MYLYELALELDVRSGEVVEAAGRVGLGALTPSSELTAQQVAQVRAAFGRAHVPAAQPAPMPAPPPPAGDPGSAWPGPASVGASKAPAAPTSYFQRWLRWRVMVAAVVLPAAVLVGVVSIVLSDSRYDENAAACRVPGNTMCSNGSMMAGESGGGGAGFAFGSSAEGDAEVRDRTSFCAAQERIRAFWVSLDGQIVAMGSDPSRGQLPVADWVREQDDTTRGDVALLRSSLGFNVTDSDETAVIEEATESVRREVLDHMSAPDVIGVRASSKVLLDEALAELERVGEAHC